MRETKIALIELPITSTVCHLIGCRHLLTITQIWYGYELCLLGETTRKRALMVSSLPFDPDAVNSIAAAS